MCFWPPMPIATQAAGVRCICLIIIRLDRGVLKMKETNHRAPLSKVCLPGWGVLDLSPLSSLSFVASNARPTATSTPSHTQSLAFPQELPPQSIFTNSERSCTAPPSTSHPADSFTTTKLQKYPPPSHPERLQTFSSLFFFLTPSQAPPTNHQLAAYLTHLPPLTPPPLPHPPPLFLLCTLPATTFSFFSS